MANRVTSEEVRAIIECSDLTDIEPFITIANLLITSVLTGAGYTDEYLKEIERWLSAHFICIRAPRIETEKIGDGQDKYHLPRLSNGLFATIYGQQVAVLDTSGLLLASLGKTAVEIDAIGDIL